MTELSNLAKVKTEVKPEPPPPEDKVPAGENRGKKTACLLLASILALTVMNITFPVVNGSGLTPEGQTALAILTFCLVLWITEALPFHITGLMGMVLLALFKVETFAEIVQAGFGNQIILFFIGVLVLSAVITSSGLGRRTSIYILSRTGNRTRLIILGFLTAGALLSMWVTNMAVAAMLMPLARGILLEEGVPPLQSNFGKSLMIACAWGPVIGGIGTPAGAGPNPLVVGFLRDMVGIKLSFLDWMIIGLPAALLLLLPTWGILLFFFKPEMKHLSRSREELKADYSQLPPLSRQERVTVVIFALTVLLWLTSPWWERQLGIEIPISLPVVLTSSLFFFPGVGGISWKKIEPEISWSGIILVVSGISVGMMLYQTGAAGWLSAVLLGRLGGMSAFLQILALILIISVLKIAFSSNTVTATIIIPIIIALARNNGLDPLGITLPAGLTSSLAFILVTSSPTNVIPYSAGYFSISDMARAGVVLTVISSIIVAGTIYFMGSIVNIY